MLIGLNFATIFNFRASNHIVGTGSRGIQGNGCG
jgi:hypothetical protein